MNDEFYYLVTLDFFNDSKPEQYIIVGSGFVNVAERISKDIADDTTVVGIHIEEIGEYPTVEEINNFINKKN